MINTNEICDLSLNELDDVSGGAPKLDGYIYCINGAHGEGLYVGSGCPTPTWEQFGAGMGQAMIGSIFGF